MYESELAAIKNNTDVRANLIKIKAELKTPAAIDALKLDKEFDEKLLPALLQNEDPKVRKNAVLIMGLLCLPEYGEYIYNGYMNEMTMFVRSAYLTALKTFDYSAHKEALLSRKKELEAGNFDEKDIKHIAEEVRILKEMFPDSTEHEKHRFVYPDYQVTVMLTATKEMIPSLLSEIVEISGAGNTRKIFCGIITRTSRISEFNAIRFYKDMFFPIDNMRFRDKSELVADICKSDIYDILSAMTEDNGQPFFFRLAAKDLDVQKMAAAIETLSGGRLVNSVSDYEIEIRLFRNRDGKYAVAVKFFERNDRRFSYRKNYVAASINPVNAAAIVYLAKEYMEKDAQVLDPFCGVGTMLIERDRAVKARFLYGTDTFGNAILGARENAEIAGIDINYIHRDYFDFTHEYEIDEIITNMPKLSPDSADTFYCDFFKKTSDILRDKGVIIMYSDEKNLVKKYMRLNHDYKLLREYVFNEKEGFSVFIITKQTGER